MAGEPQPLLEDPYAVRATRVETLSTVSSSAQNYSYKCHWQAQTMLSVGTISWVEQYGTGSGSDRVQLS